MYNLNIMCCVCLQTRENLQQLFPNGQEPTNYYHKLTTFMSEMTELFYFLKEINSQNFICPDCCCTIDLIYVFREKCLRNKVSLTNYFKQVYRVNEKKCHNTTNGQLIAQNKGDSTSVKLEADETCIPYDYNVNVKLEVTAWESEMKEDDRADGSDYQRDSESEIEDMTCEDILDDVDETMDDNEPDDYTVKDTSLPKSQICPEKNKEAETSSQSDNNKPNRNSPENNVELNTSVDNSTLSKSNQENLSEKPFKCRHCEKTFAKKLHRGRHETSHKKFFDILTDNDLGNQSSETQPDCAKSEDIIHDSSQDTSKCDIPITTSTVESTVTEPKQIHLPERPFKCRSCEKVFAKKMHLARHEITHRKSSDGEKKDEVEVKNSEIPNGSGASQRVEENMPCTNSLECYVQLNDTTSTHFKQENSLEKPFKCRSCDKTFTKKMHLARHETSHKESFEGVDLENKVNAPEVETETIESKQNEDNEPSYIIPKHEIQTNTPTNLITTEPNEENLAQDISIEKRNLRRHQQSRDKESLYKETSDESDFSTSETEENNSYTCKKCNVKFNSIKSFRAHNRKHDREFQCAVCSRDFGTVKQLTKHVQINHSGGEYECTMCAKKFTVFSTYKEHMRRHAGERPFQCKLCPKNFVVSYELKEHMRRHTGEKPYQCTLCNRKFTVARNLNDHMKIHSGERKYECDICEKKFYKSSTLRTHMTTHEEERKFECNECDKKYKSLSELRRHVRTHTGEKPFKCKFCDLRFTDPSNRSKHMRVHTGKVQEKKYECQVCFKKFLKPSILKVHMRHHTGERPFECHLCVKKFIKKAELVRHLKSHADGKVYKCQFCNIEFHDAASHVSHMRMHVEIDKNYECTICQKRFAKSSTLKYHMQTHLGEQPYACILCEKKYTALSELKRHLRTHTGETPYPCNFCEMSFVDTSTRSKHVRRYHSEENVGTEV